MLTTAGTYKHMQGTDAGTDKKNIKSRALKKI
jgi:hypothetical protein